MAIYDGYAVRGRIGAGVAIKQRQASIIFELGLRFSNAPAGAVLEIGPGDGHISDLSRSAGLEYLAIEGSQAIANRLAAKGYKVVRSYVPPLPPGVGSGFKSCYLLHVLEHMKSATEAAELVSEIRETLLPGGSLVIACPDYSRWGQYFFDCDYTHSYPVTKRRLIQLLQDQGYEIAHHTIYTGPVFGYFGLPISWLAKFLYWPLLDELIGPKLLSDALNRGFLTFLPNLLLVARRPEC